MAAYWLIEGLKILCLLNSRDHTELAISNVINVPKYVSHWKDLSVKKWQTILSA